MADLGEVYNCQLLNDSSDLRGGDELMETDRLYLVGVKSQRLKQLQNSWGHNVVSHLYGLSGSCAVVNCIRFIGTTQGSTNCKSSRIPAGVKL